MQTSANTKTTAAVRAVSSAPGTIRPEWVRIPQAVAIFGIGRTKLYQLIEEGRIRSVSLRKRGQTKGTRLLSYDSLAEFLENLADAE